MTPLLEVLRSPDRRVYLLAASNPWLRDGLAREFPGVTARARRRAGQELTEARWLRPDGLNLAAVHAVLASLFEHGNRLSERVDAGSRLITLDIDLLIDPLALAVLAFLRASNKPQSMTALRQHTDAPASRLDELLSAMRETGAVTFVRGLKSRHDFVAGAPFAFLRGYLEALLRAAT